jgi:hypothetical protein
LNSAPIASPEGKTEERKRKEKTRRKKKQDGRWKMEDGRKNDGRRTTVRPLA